MIGLGGTLNVPNSGIPSGSRFFPVSPAVTASSNTLGVGTLRACPVYFPNVYIKALGAEVTVVGDAGSLVRLGLYADNGFGFPGSLIADAGTIAGDSVASQELAIGPVMLNGWYWFACVVQNTVGQPTVRTCSTGNVLAQGFPLAMSTGLPAAGQQGSALFVNGVTGALPATFPAAASTNACARMWVQVN